MALTDNILGYWKFDNTSWTDSTGNGSNLTAAGNAGGTGVSIGTGKIAGDAQFNGDGQTYLTTGSNILPSGLTQLSIAVWVKATNNFFAVNASSGSTYPTSGPDISFGSSGQGQLNVFVNDDGSYDQVFGNGSGYSLTDGSWHYLVGTWNQFGNISIYVDGNLVGQTASSGHAINSTFTNPFNFNANGDATYAVGQAGEIDECGIWKRELTSAEVTALYANNRGLTYPFIKEPSIQFSGNVLSGTPANIKFSGDQLPAGPSTLKNNLLAYWNLDNDGSGNVNLNDSSGNGYILTNNNSVSLGSGIVGGDAVFNGSGQDLQNNAFPNLGSGDFTLSGWVNWSGASSGDGYGQVLSFRTGGGDQSACSISVSPGGIPNYYESGGSLNITGPTFSTGVWYNIVVTRQSGVVTMYINGTSVGTFNSVNSINSGFFCIGSNSSLDENFYGQIDEVGIWNRALNSAEITALYNSGNATSYPFDLTAEIQAYWNFNETSGTRYDSVNNYQIVETNGTVGSFAGVGGGNAANITNGDNTWLTLPAGICDIGSNAKTFSMWFYLTQTGIGYQWIGPMNGTGNDYREANIMYIESGSFLNCIFTTSDGTWTNYISYTGNSAPTANVWHHAVAVFTGSKCILYYDGSQVNSSNYSGPITSSGASYTLGEYDPYNPASNIGGTSFNGGVDELGIWNRALSQAEVTRLYNTGRGNSYPFISNTKPAFILFR